MSFGNPDTSRVRRTTQRARKAALLERSPPLRRFFASPAFSVFQTAIGGPLRIHFEPPVCHNGGWLLDVFHPSRGGVGHASRCSGIPAAASWRMDAAYYCGSVRRIAVQILTSGHGALLFPACPRARIASNAGDHRGWAQGPAGDRGCGVLPGLRPGRRLPGEA